jgi:dihydroorotase
MIHIKNVKTLSGKIEDVTLQSQKDEVIDCKGKLTMLPGVIDAHVHFRVPGHEYKEDWKTAAQAAIAGGVTMVFDMPNNNPPCVDLRSLEEKKKIIDQQLASVKIPLNYRLYLGADKDHTDDIGAAKNKYIAVKIYMGSSTGGLVMADKRDLEKVFQLAAQYNAMIAVHAEDEKLIRDNKFKYAKETDYSVHSKIRDNKVALLATEKAISLAEKFNTQLYLLHVSTKEEIDLIRDAKKRQLLVYCETTPHHLFLSVNDYAKWEAKVQVNPPVRTEKDQEALWQGIHDRTVDSIGSDHAPHTIEEKRQPYGKSPSGIPSVELMLPLLLNAANEGKLSLEEIVHLTRINLEYIYTLPHNQDIVLVDMDLEKEVRDDNLKTKCGWSPYAGRVLKGWPIYTILSGNIYKVG